MDDADARRFKIRRFRSVLQPARKLAFEEAANAAFECVVAVALRGLRVSAFLFQMPDALRGFLAGRFEAGDLIVRLMEVCGEL